jgi:hypothetical protein
VHGVPVELIILAGVVLVLGLVALLRCRREDVPETVRELGQWWRRKG